MNPEIKSEWVAALRSGDYKQTKDVLSDGQGFCCLGVLCDLAVKKGVAKFVPNDGDGVTYFTDDDEWDGDMDNTSLPSGVACWAGLVDETGCAITDPRVPFPDEDLRALGVISSFKSDKGVAHLATLNDKGKTFVEIADLIERDL